MTIINLKRVENLKRPRPLLCVLLLNVYLQLLWLENLHTNQEWGFLGRDEESTLLFNNIESHIIPVEF